MTSESPHLQTTLACIQEMKDVPETVILDGHNLTIAILKRISIDENIKVKLSESAIEEIEKNAQYLEELIEGNSGTYIYGLNTGFGGSADVRASSSAAIQDALLRLLNVGFGKTFQVSSVRTAMTVRANSLSLAFSGVSNAFVEILVDLINSNIIPAVPLRGSISASGDLVPLSYIAAALIGREDLDVYHKGVLCKCPEALKAANIKPAKMNRRDGLAVVNGTSFTVGVASPVLYDANIACLLTQVCTALSVEALHGTTESFHPVIQRCMPHLGQIEVAKNVRDILVDSKFASHVLDMNTSDTLASGRLKQDRYSLRSSPQWLGPVVETLKEANRRFGIELQAVSDNPIIDHRTKTILNGANFQGETLSVTLDQVRQTIGVCGKLLFAQFTEIVNVSLNFDLPPNLSGCDFHADFGFKGADIAMAAYMSELDHVVNPMSNYVVSAELHNQSVNSLALISCRKTKEALDILQMMLANHINMLVQAVDLRHLRNMSLKILSDLSSKYMEVSNYMSHTKWYEFVFRPKEILKDMLAHTSINGKISSLEADISKSLQLLYTQMKAGNCRTDDFLGKGTKPLYKYVRRTLGIPFYYGQCPMDKWLQDILNAIKNGRMDDILAEMFVESSESSE